MRRLETIAVVTYLENAGYEICRMHPSSYYSEVLYCHLLRCIAPRSPAISRFSDCMCAELKKFATVKCAKKALPTFHADT